MQNRRKGTAGVVGIVLALALAWPTTSAASNASPTPATPVEVANANVQDELDQLADLQPGVTVDVVRVGGNDLGDLLQDPRFLANVHALQDHLNTNDAGPLEGADVAIRDLVAIDVDGGVTVFTR